MKSRIVASELTLEPGGSDYYLEFEVQKYSHDTTTLEFSYYNSRS